MHDINDYEDYWILGCDTMELVTFCLRHQNIAVPKFSYTLNIHIALLIFSTLKHFPHKQHKQFLLEQIFSFFKCAISGFRCEADDRYALFRDVTPVL
jgi:hypothetical protein